MMNQRDKRIRDLRLARVKKDDNGVFITPLALAIDMTFQTKVNTLRHFHDKALKLGKTASEVYWSEEQNKDKPTSIVSSTKFIGGNGIGKTEIILGYVLQWVKDNGLNPVLYNKNLLKETDGVAYPQSDKDVLIVFKSCVDLESPDIRGLPIKIDQKRRVVNSDFTVNENQFKDLPSVSYSEVAIFSSMKNFLQSVLILDEINRSPELSLFNAIQNGEPVEGLELSPVTIIVSMQNSEDDGLNKVYAVDGAAKTKTQIFKVYQTVSDWLPYAYQNGIHPAIISFMSLYKQVWEVQKDNGVEIAYPTFRGSKNFSDALIQAEKNGHLNKMEASLLFQTYLGNHADSDDTYTIAESFGDFYVDIHLELLEHIEDTVNSTRLASHVGFTNKGVNDIINQMMKRGKYKLENLLEYDEEQIFEEQKNIKRIDGRDGQKYSRWLYAIPTHIINHISLLFNGTQNSIIATAIGYRMKKLMGNDVEGFMEKYKIDPSNKDDLLFIQKNELAKLRGFVFNNYALYQLGRELLKENILEVKEKREKTNSKEIPDLNLIASSYIQKYIKIISPLIQSAADMVVFLNDLEHYITINEEFTPSFDLFQLMTGKEDGNQIIHSIIRNAKYNEYSVSVKNEKNKDFPLTQKYHCVVEVPNQKISETFIDVPHKEFVKNSGEEISQEEYQSYLQYVKNFTLSEYHGEDGLIGYVIDEVDKDNSILKKLFAA